jgi:hypothetical protein
MFASKSTLLAGCVLLGLAFVPGAAPVAAQSATPDFSSTGWLNEATFEGGELIPIEGSPPLFRQDPAHPFVPNNRGAQPTYRIADLNNPNVKQWAKDVMKKDNAEVLAGKFAFTARSSCAAAGVPGHLVLLGGALFILQTPNEVTMIFDSNAEPRHIQLNAAHPADVKPSWYGDSVGHYEGDTLVVDTIGLNDKTFLDNYRTPHTEKLHVTERWRLIENGAKIEVLLTIDDPDTFNAPFKALRRYDRVNRTFEEDRCSENNSINLFDYGTPTAEMPDF